MPKVAPGVLIALADGYDLPDESIRQMVAANREFGFEGEVFFYEEGLKERPELFKTLYAERPQR